MINILVINGPNLNMLGMREETHYGKMSLNDIILSTNKYFDNKVKVNWFQSNSESDILEKIQGCYKDNDLDCLIINPAAFTHYSIAIMDSLIMLNKLFKIEVHLSNTAAREEFRKSKLTTTAVDCVIEGFLELSYIVAINAYLIKRETNS